MDTQQHDQLLDRIDQFLRARDLRWLAVIVLEVGRPFVFLGSQLLWVAQPAFSLVFPSFQLQRWAQFLESPEGVENLIKHLEES